MVANETTHQSDGPHSWWRLTRAGNAIIAGAAAIVGAYLTDRSVDFAYAVWVAFAPMFIVAAGNIHNDLLDLATDRISHPDRPLVTGAISLRAATTVMSVAYVAGLIVAASLSSFALTIAGVVVLGLTIYNHRLSRKQLIGNIVVSAMGALPILYGGISLHGLADPRWIIAASAAVIAFWIHFARELLKDAIDVEGDIAAGRRTLAVLQGSRLTIRFGAFAMLIAAALTVWLGTTGWLSTIFLIGSAFTVIPALLLGAAQCTGRPEIAPASLWASWLKVTMLAGLVWIVLGVAAP
jgi:geranylgeranylglycerol-phosphate geranylgeranyltransferase